MIPWHAGEPYSNLDKNGRRKDEPGLSFENGEPANVVILASGPLRVHPEAQCRGRGIPCCIHSPSNHRMRAFDMNWRADTGVMERICPHGVGHPDPDHMAFMVSVSDEFAWQGVHGCDGCCTEEGKFSDRPQYPDSRAGKGHAKAACNRAAVWMRHWAWFRSGR